MNFTVYADNDLIYNKTVIDEHGHPQYLIIEPLLRETVDEFCSLTYRCKKGSPAYNKSIELVPRIKVYEDGTLYWTGRILKSTPNIHAEKEIYVEDFLGVLCDGIYRPFEFYGTVESLLKSVVNANNAQVSDSQQIYAVVCDVDLGNIARSSEGYNTCWSIIQEKLLKPLGGYMWIEYDNQERAILHYSMSARRSATQKISFGENLKDYKVEYNFDGFYTACVPLGAKDNITKQYVTIASVNDGKDYLIDESNASIYGIIFAPTKDTTWEDVHEPSNLYQRGVSWIQSKASRLIQSITLSAHDLSGLNAEYQSFRWLDGVYVSAKEIDGTFVIKNLSRRLDKPLSLAITMGDVRSSIAGAAVSNQNGTIDVVEYVDAHYTTNEEVTDIVDNKTDELWTETLTQLSAIRQEANAIILEALEEYEKKSDIEELKTSIASQFQILADRIETVFTRTTETITKVNGSLSSQLETVVSFIRMIPTIPGEQEGGIVIGESNSEIKLKLENDVLYFFTGDEAAVNKLNALAYFSSGMLYVNESQLHVMSIGTADASMHFSIVGEGNLQCLFLSPRRV